MCSCASPDTVGFVSEVYSGFQGEGLLLGFRQIFVRLAGCNLRCRFCDTPQAQTQPDAARIERTSGHRDFFLKNNPFTVACLFDSITRLDTPPRLHHSIAITGGEPLCQPYFVASLLRLLRNAHFSIMLETNGTLHEALPAVLPFLDFISMDIKLPSAAGIPDMFSQHEVFLRQAFGNAKVFVKIVLTSDTDPVELIRAADIIASVNQDIPLILQPVTPRSNITPPLPDWLFYLHLECASRLHDVRVVPQCHHIINQL